MEYSFSEYADMHCLFGEARGNLQEARRLYAERYPNRRLPNARTFANVDRRLRETGTLSAGRSDQGAPRRRSGNLNDRVMDLVIQNPTISIRRIATRLQQSTTTIWRILHDNYLHPYHFQPTQTLEDNDPVSRLNYCRWLLQQTSLDQTFVGSVIFTDEATFTRDGIFNLHNLHTWSEENPHEIMQVRSQRGFKFNVWCGIIGNYLIGPFELPVLTGETYLSFLRNQLEEALDELIPLAIRRKMWYMHDGAPAHFSYEVRNFLNEVYGEKWIGRRGPINWPARSPDLNPLDFFLWGYLKNKVYSSEINSREELWNKIVNSCNEIRNNRDVFIRLRQNLVRRLNACVDENGFHFEHLL